MEVNGVAHIYISVAKFEECAPFYRRLLPFLGLTFVVRDTPDDLYCIGGRTGFGVTRCAPEHRGDAYAQGRPGLHHVCFRARSREDVDAVYQLVSEMGAKIVRAPEIGRWAPGYYSVLFEDPDGIRLEVNYIPGKGLLASQDQSGAKPVK
ncbi:MAG TPA: VOC family protein [Candidatus Binataceae bacterium]|nr:VOC family protein [Candidatus Binataceae bacterium]